jgi:hypothetical protein
MYAQPLSLYQPKKLLILLYISIVTLMLPVLGLLSLKQAHCGGCPDDFISYVYDGDVIEYGERGLVDDTVTTAFVRQPDGTINGEYKVATKQGVYTGVLFQRSAMKDNNCSFDWYDKWGHGVVNVAFDPDFCQFAGKWSSSDGRIMNAPWGGHRRTSEQ